MNTVYTILNSFAGFWIGWNLVGNYQWAVPMLIILIMVSIVRSEIIESRY